LRDSCLALNLVALKVDGSNWKGELWKIGEFGLPERVMEERPTHAGKKYKFIRENIGLSEIMVLLGHGEKSVSREG
jgi:hypothetical protein